jgi:hypothetical protein
LYLCDTTRRVIRVCDVVLVYAKIAASSAQHEIDYLGHSSGLMLVESRHPAGCNVFESVAAGKYIGYMLLAGRMT